MSRKNKKRMKRNLSGKPIDLKDRLLRKLTLFGHSTDSKVQMLPPGQEKMSDVIFQFAEPNLKTAPNDSAYKFGLEFCIMVWNLSLFPKEEQANQIKQIMAKVGLDDPDTTQKMIHMLLQRKIEFFSKYRRMIVDYTLSSEGRHWHLAVASEYLER